MQTHSTRMFVFGAIALTYAFFNNNLKAGPNKPNTRGDFRNSLELVKVGHSTKSVRDHLGEPDEIRTLNDAPPYYFGSRELWCYGTIGSNTFPTLGQVGFGANGKVVLILGNHGQPPDPLLFQEAELRGILELLAKTPSLESRDYHPNVMIQIVNTLQPLGKDRACAAIAEFLRVSSEWYPPRHGVFLLLRILFEVPERPRHFPRLTLGIPLHATPKDPALLPRFPVIILDDVPLVLPLNYVRTGPSPDVDSELDYVRQYANIRKTRLQPKPSALKMLSEFVRSPNWIYENQSQSAEAKIVLIKQLLRLVDPVYRTKRDFGFISSTKPIEIERLWVETEREFAHLNVAWDSRINGYIVLKKKNTKENEGKENRRKTKEKVE